MDSKELTVVIVTFKSEAKILDCLRSIGDQANIIVVENSKNKDFKNDLENKFPNLNAFLLDGIWVMQRQIILDLNKLKQNMHWY